MRKVMCAVVILFAFISIGAGYITDGEHYVSPYEEMYTTAYCLHGITANGGTTRKGICACNPRLGQVAIVYTLDGEYLGLFECTDTGTTNGLQSGVVIDIWFDTYEECVEWMGLTGGKVKVLWIDGKG